MKYAIVISILSLGLAPLAAPVLVGSAEAKDTCAWSAQMEEDEGGPTMVASSCGSDTYPAFRLMCGDTISVRYDVGDSSLSSQPDSIRYSISTGGKSVEAEFRYEEMDGAFATYAKPDAPIIALLKSGSDVTITALDFDLPPRVVSLNGSSAAIDKLIESCK